MNIWLLRLSILLLLSVAFFAPANIPNSVFISKQVGLWLVVGFTTIFASIKFGCGNNQDNNIKSVDIVVVMFLMIIPISFSLVDSFQNITQILVNVSLGLIYINTRILSFNFKKTICLNVILESTTTILIIQLVIVLGQSLNFIPRYAPGISSTGMFFNSGPFAIFTMSLAVINWSVFLKYLLKGHKGYAIFNLIVFLFSCYFIILSFSRSAWLGGISGILVCSTFLFFNHYKIKINSFKYPVYKLLLFIVGIGIVPFSIWLFNFNQSSASGRFLIWRSSLLLIKDYWAMGVGNGNFAPSYINYQAKFFEETIDNVKKYGDLAGDIRFSFNDMVTIFCENGFSSFFLFIFLLCKIVSALRSTLKDNNITIVFFAMAIFCSLVVIIIAGLTAYPLSVIPIAILFWLLVGIMVFIVDSNSSRYNKYWFPKKNWTRVVLFIIGISFFSYGIVMYKNYIEFDKIKSISNAKVRLEKLNSLYPLLKNDAVFLEELGENYIEIKAYEKAILPLKRALMLSPYKKLYFSLGFCYEELGYYEMARQQYFVVHKAIPNLIQPRFQLAKLEFRRGNYSLFEKMAVKTLNYIPKINSNEVIEMKQQLNLLMIKAKVLEKISSKHRY